MGWGADRKGNRPVSAREEAVPERIRWSDRLRVLTVLLLGGTLTLLAAGSLRQADALRLKEHRSAATDRVVQAFRQELTRTLEALRTAALMLEVHPQLTREQFNSYMRKLVQDQLSINLVEWQPIVAARDLKAFEAAARADGLPDFEVIEPDASGKGWRPVSGRDPYVVIRYAWPESYRTLGYDMSFSPERMQSKLQSTARGEPVASGAFEFMKEGKVRSGSTAIAISTTVFEPDRRARGYLAAVVDLPTLFQHASERARDAQLDLLVYPGTRPDELPLFSTRPSAAGAAPASARSAELEPQELSALLEFAGQRWRLVLQPRPGFYAGQQPQLALWTLVAGGLMTLLMARAVMLVQASRRRIESAERAATQAHQSLRIQTDRLLEAQRIAHLGSWQADLQGATLAWSTEVRRILDLPPHELPEGLADQRARFTEESWARFEAALRDAATLPDGFEIELERLRPDGSRCWLLVRGLAQPGEGGPATQVRGVAMDISARKRAELEIQNLAFTDALTALPNRRLLIDRLGHALAFSERHQRFGALLFVDLDGFKKVNDTFGHQRGDLLLQQVAQRIQAAVRHGDTVSRLGGDEFVVLLENIGSTAAEAAANAEMAGKKLLELLKLPHTLGSDLHVCTGSIGLTVFGAERVDPEELLRRADVAMYRAKAAGRHQLCFYDPSMQAVILARAQRESDLREAIGSQWLRLHYQPQVDAAGRVTGAEALLRLQLPGRGLVGPQHFIALAEETGLINPLGNWVLQTATDQLARWASRPDRAHLSLSVNLSPRQFRSADFLPFLESLLASGRIPAQRLKLELTEGVLLDDVDDAIQKMQRIVAMGLRFSLDDFGTGFSSLSYLKRLPLDELKIDKSFVDDLVEHPDGGAIARMIIALGESLGLGVIAEGVERAEQRELLERLGCRSFQGYLFGRPMPVEELEALLDEALAGLPSSA